MNASDRVPGDPTYVRALWRGEIAMPPLVTASTRWEARQATVINNWPVRARMLLGTIDQFISEIGEERAGQWTLIQVRDAVAEMAEDHDR